MKKTMIIAAALLVMSFVSCTKDRTCSCTSTTVDYGTSYSVNVNGQQSSIYNTTSPINTSEIKYNKITKKYANQNCIASDVEVQNYDNTTPYGGGYITGNKGAKTTTKTCELK